MRHPFIRLLIPFHHQCESLTMYPERDQWPVKAQKAFLSGCSDTGLRRPMVYYDGMGNGAATAAP